MFLENISVKTQLSIYAIKNQVLLQFPTSLIMRVISVSNTKVKHAVKVHAI